MRRAVAVVLPLVLVLPLAFLVLGALRPPGVLPPAGLEILPRAPSLESFGRAFELQPLGRQLANSLLIAVIAVPLSVITASAAGFGLLLLAPRARQAVIAVMVLLLLVPPAALWVPRFAMFAELGLVDTYVPLIAPALMGTSPFLALLCFWSARRIPRELIDAGRLQGLGAVALWWRVGVPLMRPTLFAVGALAFVMHWGNFIDPLLYLYDPDKATLPLGLRALRELKATDFGVLMAGALVAVVPAVLAFLATQRAFLSGDRRP